MYHISVPAVSSLLLPPDPLLLLFHHIYDIYGDEQKLSLLSDVEDIEECFLSQAALLHRRNLTNIS